MSLKLTTPVDHIKGVGAAYKALFEKQNIFTVEDLLLHFPASYIDFTRPAQIFEPGLTKLYPFDVISWGLSRNFRRRLSVLRVTVTVCGEKADLVFFNQPYLADLFKENPKAYLYGSFQVNKKIFQAVNPAIYKEQDLNKHPVEPLYRSIVAIKSGKLKQLMTDIFNRLEDEPEPLPEYCIGKYGFPSVSAAFKQIHFPDRWDEEAVTRSKQRFVYSEFLYFQLELQYIREKFQQVPRRRFYTITPELKVAVARKLPFRLTEDQETACAEITADLQSPYAMQRLLQGDVGSGKTIVAFIALSYVMADGFQGAFLAPTEILAGQHFNNAQRIFGDKQSALLTGSTPPKRRKEILKQLAAGEIDLLVGTHALFTETVRFKNPAMMVIDEQHRFGVSQRAAFYYKGTAVDLLVTTATPIPRTMLLSLYNDLAVSTIKTKPEGRLPIITRIKRTALRDEFYRGLKMKINDGAKAYIILPLIEKSEFFSELKDIETETAYFKKIFKGIPFATITGRTPAQERDDALKQLADGHIKILIATTVIEVGIDVKDAVIIVMEDADRYGLSQLHQLRGRVGRGELQSYCYLFPSINITERGKQRLAVIVAENDGFHIAETDLKMRGGGIIAGLQQSGRFDFKTADMQDHHDLFQQACIDAQELIRDKTLLNEKIKTFLQTVETKTKQLNFS